MCTCTNTAIYSTSIILVTIKIFHNTQLICVLIASAKPLEFDIQILQYHCSPRINFTTSVSAFMKQFVIIINIVICHPRLLSALMPKFAIKVCLRGWVRIRVGYGTSMALKPLMANLGMSLSVYYSTSATVILDDKAVLTPTNSHNTITTYTT